MATPARAGRGRPIMTSSGKLAPQDVLHRSLPGATFIARPEEGAPLPLPAMCKFTEREREGQLGRETRGRPGLSPLKRSVSNATAPAISCAHGVPLSHNARLTNSELAQHVGQFSSPCRTRVNRLKAAGYPSLNACSLLETMH